MTIPTRDLMRGFPPPPEAQVTLENWRDPPFNRWGFRNVRRVVPTAAVGRGRGPVWKLPRAPRNLDGIAFEGVDGGEWTVGRLLEESYADALVVLHEGRVVAERYEDGMTADTPHILFSVTKSVTGSLAGILVEKGLLDPAASVADYVPEAAGSAYGDATVRHVLDMVVGVRFVEDYTDTTGDFARYRQATGWNPVRHTDGPDNMRDFLVTLRKEGEHGAAFHYVSPNTDLLGWILERASGIGFPELLSREIWSRLGAEHDGYIAVDRLGAARAAGGLCLTARDFARFGQMHLENGVADGQSVIPAGWIRDIRRNGDPAAWRRGNFAGTMPDARYRAKWYALEAPYTAYCGLGVYGQVLWVDPGADVVIAKFSSQPPAVDAALGENEMRAFAAIGAALSH